MKTSTILLWIVAIAIGVAVGVLVIYSIWPPCPDCPGTPTPTTTPAATATPTAQRTPTPEPTPTPAALLWDSRLDALNVKVERVAGAKYKLTKVWLTVNGQWDGVPPWAWYYVDKVTGGGGDHNMFAGVYQLNGEPLAGKNVIFGWPGTQTNFVTDAAGWGNGDCQAVYYPDKGQTGPYYLEPLKGDRLIGGGLPYGQHISIFGLWEEQNLLQRVLSVFAQ